MPYYENSDIGQNDIALPDPLTILGINPLFYEEIESLKNFWKRYNKVQLDVFAIEKQKEKIKKQNDSLRTMLQQYFDGFTVNNVVMKNENPLLIIDNSERVNNVLEEKKNLTIQEGSHIFLDVSKQFNFSKIN